MTPSRDKILLDANAYTELRRGSSSVAHLVDSADKVLLSAVVLGELLRGFRGGSRFDYNLNKLQAFLREHKVLFVPVSYDTADRYGRIAAALQRKGKLIPTNDMWIAAHAIELGATLVSFDRHFERVDGLALALLH